MTVRFSDNIEQAARAADRFIALGGEYDPDRGNLLMDLTAADGVNGNAPIDWDRLLGADDLTLVHDVGGIQRHLDRETGELRDHFLPRCARGVHHRSG